MKVSGTMTKEVVVVDPESSLVEASQLMSDLGCRHLPVVQDGELVGLLSDRDIQRAVQVAMVDPEDQRPVAFGLEQNWQVKDYMSLEVETIEPQAELIDVVNCIVDHKVGAVVVTEASSKKVVGIITETDLLVVLKRLLLHEDDGGLHFNKLAIKLGLGKVADLLSQSGI